MAVEAAQPDSVVCIIIDAYETLCTVRVGEDPGAKAFFDALLARAERHFIGVVRRCCAARGERSDEDQSNLEKLI